MEPEIIIGVLAIFVSGGAMGAAGTLLGQWVLKKISGPPPRQATSAAPRELELLKAELADMSVLLHSVDTRMDFTEQLLGGALLGSAGPEPLPPPEPRDIAALSDASDVGRPSEPSRPSEVGGASQPSEISKVDDTSDSLEAGQ